MISKVSLSQSKLFLSVILIQDVILAFGCPYILASLEVAHLPHPPLLLYLLQCSDFNTNKRMSAMRGLHRDSIYILDYLVNYIALVAP